MALLLVNRLRQTMLFRTSVQSRLSAPALMMAKIQVSYAHAYYATGKREREEDDTSNLEHQRNRLLGKREEGLEQMVPPDQILTILGHMPMHLVVSPERPSGLADREWA